MALPIVTPERILAAVEAAGGDTEILRDAAEAGLLGAEASLGGAMGRPRKPCGTQAAWQWHRRHGEPPCEPCAHAHREHAAEDTRRRRARRDSCTVGRSDGGTVYRAHWQGEPTPELVAALGVVVDAVKTFMGGASPYVQCSGCNHVWTNDPLRCPSCQRLARRTQLQEPRL